MKNRRRKTAAGIAAALVLAMALNGCGAAADTETAEEENAVTVSTKLVETGTISLMNSFVGTISPQETVMVIPLAAGTVTDTFFEVGDTVQAGDVLFKIDDESAKLQYESAQLGRKNASQTADSTMDNLLNQKDSTELQLEGSGVQAQSSFEAAQIAYMSSKNAYEKLEKQYNDTKKQLEDLKAQAASQSAPAQNTLTPPVIQAADPSVTDNDYQKLQEEIVGLQTALANLQKAQNDPQIRIAELEAALSSMESARDQAYQGYLTAGSGYNAARKSLELAGRTDVMTREQLEQSVERTEAQMDLSLEMAQVPVDQAQLALDYYTVKAPVSGMIESKGVEKNGIASQSSPAYTIVNNSTMTVTFQVSETVKNTLSIGQTITLERNRNTYTAAITEIGVSVNVQSGLFQIKACVSADGTELPSGVSVKVNADTYRAENAMIIPYDAVYYENEGAYVYTSVDGRAVKTPITTGIFDDENIVVTGGLNVGDIVVTSWSPQLTGGVLLRAAKAGTAKEGTDGAAGAGADAGSAAE